MLLNVALVLAAVPAIWRIKRIKDEAELVLLLKEEDLSLPLNSK